MVKKRRVEKKARVKRGGTNSEAPEMKTRSVTYVKPGYLVESTVYGPLGTYTRVAFYTSVREALSCGEQEEAFERFRVAGRRT
jgi:hypothetical protein